MKRKKNTALVNKYSKCHLLQLSDSFVLHYKKLVEIVICHEDMTGKRGENVTGVSILPFCRVLIFW